MLVTLPGTDTRPAAPAEHDLPGRSAQVLGALAWCAAGVLGLMASRPLADNSFLTHLATGRLLQEQGLPTANPFLFTGGDFPVPSWWFSGVLAVAEDLAGAAGIRLVVVALAASLGVALVALARPERGVTRPTTVVGVAVPVALVVVTLAPFTTPRPHLAGFLLLAGALLLWRDDRSPWWMVPVFATWVNVHGTWVYGLVVLVLLTLSASVEQRRWVRVPAVVAAGAGVVLGGAMYPDRFGLVGLPFAQFGDERAREALAAYQEWAPAGWAHPLTWAVVLLGVSAAVALVRERRWPSLVVAGLLVVMGLSAGRLLPVAAVSLLPWAAAAFGTVGPGPGSRRLAVPVRVVGMALCLLAVLSACRGPAYDLSRYPVGAVAWLEQRGLVASADVRVVSHLEVGNYLEWRYGTDANAFTDDRPSVDAMLQHRSLDQARSDWPDVLEQLQPDVLVFRVDAPIVAPLDRWERWSRAATIGGYAVYCAPSVRDRCS